jgi:hypothetical protein
MSLELRIAREFALSLILMPSWGTEDTAGFGIEGNAEAHAFSG